MITHRRFLPLLAVAAGIAVVLALACFITGDGPAPASAAGALANGSSERGVPDRPENDAGQAVDSAAPPMRPAIGMVAAPEGIDPFAPALSDAELLRTERRMFQAQTWEVDLGKALDLPPGERLERRSGLFRLSGGGGLVRLDRVYRLGGARPAMSVKPALQGAPAPAPALATAIDPTGPLAAGGGELVWANAMVADHLMVQVENGVTRERLAAALPRPAKVGKQVTAGGLYLVEVPTEGERSVERAVLALNQIKGVVKFAEPDFVLTSADTTPNDPLFGSDTSTQQWHLSKIRAPRAWDVLTGPPFAPAHPQYDVRLQQTVVAVVDTGFDYDHPDLISRLWTNPGETGGGKETNGIDDDGNGKIDDWQGWDFIGQNPSANVLDPDNDPMDDVGHGTHVAGIIGAVGNNVTGGSGVCWNVRLLNLRIIKAQGTGTIGYYSGAVAAMDYIRTLNNLGRRVAVANHSWGGSGYSLAMLNAINNPLAAPDPLPVGITSTFANDVNQIIASGAAAEVAKIKIGMTIAGTSIPTGTIATIVETVPEGTRLTLTAYTTSAGSSSPLTFTNPIRPKPYGVVHVAAAGNSRYNSDRIPTYPATLPSSFMISVGATGVDDAVAQWSVSAGSNYGRLNVDLFAPGSGIWSTYWKSATNLTPPASYTAVPGSSTQGYVALNGTSMAAPQVSATAALLRMWQPALTDLQTRQILIERAEVLPSLQYKCISSGRLNVARVIDRLYVPNLLASGGTTSGAGSIATPLAGAQGTMGLVASDGDTNYAVIAGKVFAWGDNQYGQLGSNMGEKSAVPVEVPGLQDIVMVAPRMALAADGQVWTWGTVQWGNPVQPQPVPNLTDIIWIAYRELGMFAVKADGTVWKWRGATPPTQIVGLSDIVQVEASSGGMFALRSDGTVWSGGSDRRVRNTATNSHQFDGPPEPYQVPGISGAIQIALDFWIHRYALLSDGTVMQWGGLTEDSEPSERLLPMIPSAQPGVSNIIQIAGSSDFSVFALDADGHVYAWGYNNLGNGSDATPTAFSSVATVFQSSSGSIASIRGGKGAVAVTADGSVFTWGDNNFGQLGIGTTGNKRLASLNQSLTAIGAATIAGGGEMCYALLPQGKLYSWGRLAGTISPYQSPIVYPFLENLRFSRVAVGSDVTLGLSLDGTLLAWGLNSAGQLGNGTTTDSHNLPVTVSGVAAPTFFTAQASPTQGRPYCLAVVGGHVRAWGDNSWGQLGDGTMDAHPIPIEIPNLSDIVEVACGSIHALALDANGQVWGWGDNSSGQLGDDAMDNSPTPRLIPLLSAVTHIFAYGYHNWAIKTDGSVWAWGGQDNSLGLGENGVAVTSPTEVPLLHGALRIVPTYSGTFAVMDDGRLLAWSNFGNGAWGYLGTGEANGTPVSAPTPVIGLANVIDIAGSDFSNHARLADGSVWSWGEDGAGVGDGSEWSNVPVAVLGLGGASDSLATLGTLDTQSSWLLGNFSFTEMLDPAFFTDGADPDGDGISNLLEYALGLNPRARSGTGLPVPRVDFVGASAQSESAGQVRLFSLPTVDLTSGKHYMALTVERYGDIRQDIDYLVEVSADLQNWMSGDPFTITVLDTAETLEVYDATAIEDASKRFMRLRIQRK